MGKTAIVEAWPRPSRTTSRDPHRKQLYTLDLALVAGSRYPGDFGSASRRCSRRSAPEGDIILFIDEIHTPVGRVPPRRHRRRLDPPAHAGPGELQTIGATTLDEYRKHLEKDAASSVASAGEGGGEPRWPTIEILKGLRDRYETHHRVTITDQALSDAASWPTAASRIATCRTRPSTSSTSRLGRAQAHGDPPTTRSSSGSQVVQQKKEAVGPRTSRGRAPQGKEKELLAEEAKETEIKASGVDLFDEVDESPSPR